MKKLSRLIAVILVCGFISLALGAANGGEENDNASGDNVKVNIMEEIEGPWLEYMARQAAGKPAGPVFREDVSGLEAMTIGGGRKDRFRDQTPDSMSAYRIVPLPDRGISPISTLEGIQHFSGLRQLEMVNAPELKDASRLAELKNLENLIIWYAPAIESFDFLGGMERLNALYLFGCDVSLDDFPVLHGMDSVVMVACNIDDLTGFNEKFPGLRWMDFSGIDDRHLLPSEMSNRITDIRPLVDCGNLKYITLRHNRIRDISPLLEMDGILLARLDHNPCGDMIIRQSREGNNPLKALANARYVRLGRVGLSDAAPLEVLAACQNLYIFGNPIADISPLAKLRQLRTLNMNDCMVECLEPLSRLNLRRMMRIDAAGNVIRDISPLAGCHPIGRLDLSRNRIEDISPIVEGAVGRAWGTKSVIILRGNPLSERAFEDVLRLEGKEVDVRF